MIRKGHKPGILLIYFMAEGAIQTEYFTFKLVVYQYAAWETFAKGPNQT